MRCRSAYLSCLLVLACSQPLAPSLDESVRGHGDLEQLTPGQGLLVQLHSQGCFHNVRAELQFTRIDTVVQVRGNTWWVNGDEALAPRALSEDEIRSLDEELDVLRHVPHEGSCTTVTTYVFTWLDGNRTTRIEQVADSTCALMAKYYFGPDSAGPYPVLSFTQLAAEARFPRQSNN